MVTFRADGEDIVRIVWGTASMEVLEYLDVHFPGGRYRVDQSEISLQIKEQTEAAQSEGLKRAKAFDITIGRGKYGRLNTFPSKGEVYFT